MFFKMFSKAVRILVCLVKANCDILVFRLKWAKFIIKWVPVAGL